MAAITVGKYIPNHTVMHRLDPRVKLFANIVFIVLVFMSRSFFVSGMLFIPILFTFLLSRSKWTKLLSMLIPVFIVGVFLFTINLFIHADPQGHVYWHWKSITLSDGVLLKTSEIMIRIYCMIIATTVLTATTKPIDMTRAIEDLMFPLKFIKFPVHIIAMIIAIALRFIPTLLDEAQRIMKAQASRGVDFKNGGPKSKVKSTVTLIIPLFVTAFAKAEDLGNAMETRGYDPYAKRTHYRKYSIKWIDIVALIIVTGMIVFSALALNNAFEIPSWWILYNTKR